MVAPKQRFLLVHWVVLMCSYDDIGTQAYAGRVTPEQAQQLPADRFIAHATTADLPNSHDGVVFFGEANGGYGWMKEAAN
jgi:hypothetical protein